MTAACDLTSLYWNLVTLSHTTFRMTAAILRPWARCENSLKQQSLVVFVCSCSFLAYAWPNKECMYVCTCLRKSSVARQPPALGQWLANVWTCRTAVYVGSVGIAYCYLVCGWMVSACAYCVLYSACMSCVLHRSREPEISGR